MVSFMQEDCFSLGVLADIQYADIDDGWDYAHTAQRYYRNALNVLQNSVRALSAQKNSIAIIQLGDIIDGKCRFKDPKEALTTVLNVLNTYPKRVYHCIGNHELYNFKQKDLMNLLFENPQHQNGYYTIDFSSKWRGVILNAYDFSLLGMSKKSKTYRNAMKLVKTHNKNINATGNWLKDLEGEEKRWVSYNGAFSYKQLKWLEDCFDECQRDGKKAIVFMHTPIYPFDEFSLNVLAWNYDKVLDIFRRYPKGLIPLVFNGHEHKFKYAHDKETDIRYISVGSPLEQPSSSAEVHCSLCICQGRVHIQYGDFKEDFFCD